MAAAVWIWYAQLPAAGNADAAAGAAAGDAAAATAGPKRPPCVPAVNAGPVLRGSQWTADRICGRAVHAQGSQGSDSGADVQSAAVQVQLDGVR